MVRDRGSCPRRSPEERPCCEGDSGGRSDPGLPRMPTHARRAGRQSARPLSRLWRFRRLAVPDRAAGRHATCRFLFGLLACITADGLLQSGPGPTGGMEEARHADGHRRTPRRPRGDHALDRRRENLVQAQGADRHPLGRPLSQLLSTEGWHDPLQPLHVSRALRHRSCPRPGQDHAHGDHSFN